MKWLNNLQLIAEGKSGKCPFCQSDNTDSGFNVVDAETKMGYGSVWCNDCKKAYHISRIEITDQMSLKPIPNDLIYQ